MVNTSIRFHLHFIGLSTHDFFSIIETEKPLDACLCFGGVPALFAYTCVLRKIMQEKGKFFKKFFQKKGASPLSLIFLLSSNIYDQTAPHVFSFPDPAPVFFDILFFI